MGEFCSLTKTKKGHAISITLVKPQNRPLHKACQKPFIRLCITAPFPVAARSLQALHIRGLFMRSGFHRFYPSGAMVAHVVGVTDVDGHGQEGQRSL